MKIAAWPVEKVVPRQHLEKVAKAVDQRVVTTEAQLKKEVIQAHILHVHFQVDKTAVVLVVAVDIIHEMYIHPKAQLKTIIQSPMEATPTGNYDYLFV